jgi:hypothetical protein
MSEDLVPVLLIDFPVALADRVNRHFEALQRELALIQFSDDATRAAVPRRLLEVAERATAQLAAAEIIGRERLAEEIAGGASLITIQAMMPSAASASIGTLLDFLAEADAFCREGELITVAMPADCCALRDWMLNEIVNQTRGAEPTPWTGPSK